MFNGLRLILLTLVFVRLTSSKWVPELVFTPHFLRIVVEVKTTGPPHILRIVVEVKTTGPPHILRIVVEVKTTGPPHVLRLFLGMLPVKYFQSNRSSFCVSLLFF